MLAIEAALDAGFPPSILWGVGDGKSWSTKDRKIVIAWKHYTNTLCGGCGQSRMVTTDPEYEGIFRAKDDAVVCLACASIDRLHERNEKSKKSHQHGAKTTVEVKWDRPGEATLIDQPQS